MTPAERLVSRGRRGEFLAVLPALLDLAADRDGDPGEAWVAGAAAIRILFWCDRFTEAADLAEALITDTAPAGGEICDQDPPLIPALLAAHARWWPFATWDAIPDPMVLHPTLRTVCTDRVRTYYLTTPIGPEADKATQP